MALAETPRTENRAKRIRFGRKSTTMSTNSCELSFEVPTLSEAAFARSRGGTNPTCRRRSFSERDRQANGCYTAIGQCGEKLEEIGYPDRRDIQVIGGVLAANAIAAEAGPRLSCAQTMTAKTL